jgi:hypothetical protein
LLYQCVETRSTEVFWLDCCFIHFHTSVSTSSSTAKLLPPRREFLYPVVNCFTRQTLPIVNRKHFLMNILCIESFCPQKRTTESCSSVIYSPSTVAILTTETSLWTWAWASGT